MYSALSRKAERRQNNREVSSANTFVILQHARFLHLQHARFLLITIKVHQEIHKPVHLQGSGTCYHRVPYSVCLSGQTHGDESPMSSHGSA